MGCDSGVSRLQLFLGGFDEGQRILQRYVPLHVVGWGQDEVALAAVFEELNSFSPNIFNTAVG